MEQCPSSPSASAPVTALKAQIALLRGRVKEVGLHGSRLLGRWFHTQGAKAHPELAAKMEAALRATLTKPRDRRLFGLPVESGTRLLRSERVDAELSEVRADLGRLRKREAELAKEAKTAKRSEDDGRRIIQGKIIRRWRTDDPVFALLLEEELPNYFRAASDFEAVELPVPAGWRPSERAAEDKVSVDTDRAVGASLPASPDASQGRVSGPREAESAPPAAQKETVPQKSAPKANALPSPAPILSRSVPHPATKSSAAPSSPVSASASEATEGRAAP